MIESGSRFSKHPCFKLHVTSSINSYDEKIFCAWPCFKLQLPTTLAVYKLDLQVVKDLCG